MTSKQQFSPLCDVHHTFMRRLVEEDSDDIRSYHACARRDCTRVFRHCSGYSDRVDEEFDLSRALLKSCPACGSTLYLVEVDRSREIETWECPQLTCEFSEEFPSPAGR